MPDHDPLGVPGAAAGDHARQQPGRARRQHHLRSGRLVQHAVQVVLDLFALRAVLLHEVRAGRGFTGVGAERQPFERRVRDRREGRPDRGDVSAQSLFRPGRRVGRDDVEPVGEEVCRPAGPDHPGADHGHPLHSGRGHARPPVAARAAARATNGSSALGSASTSRLATSSSARAEQDPLRRQLQLLARPVLRDDRHRRDPVRDVPGRQLGAQRGGDPAPQRIVQLHAVAELHVEQQLTVPARRVLQVHDQAVDDLRKLLDHRGRTPPSPAAPRRG